MNIPALRSWSGRLLVPALVLPTLACPLLAIEPDEIDVADEIGDTEGEAATNTAGDEGSEDGQDTSGSEGTGTDTGDPTDTSDTTGMTDAEETGDGDGDQTGDDSSDTSNSDTTEDTGTTTDGPACESSGSVMVGENPVVAPDTPSELETECGGELSGEAILEFVAAESGTYRFSVTGADFTAVLYFIDADCEPVGECAVEPAQLEVPIEAETPYWVVVDSNSGSGAGILVIEKI